MTFFDWHRRQTQQWMARLHMTPYQALWFAWFKGIVLGAAVAWWLLADPRCRIHRISARRVGRCRLQNVGGRSRGS